MKLFKIRLSLGIQFKLLVFISCFVLLLGAIVGTSLHLANTQKTDVALIQTAAGQRLLLNHLKTITKRLAEALEDESSTDELKKTLASKRDLFENILLAMMRGGAFINTEGQKVILPSSARKARMVFQNVETAWKNYRRSLELIMDERLEVPSDTFYQALDTLEKTYEPVAQEAGKLIPILEIASTQSIRRLKQLLITAFGVTLVVSLLSLYLTMRLLIHPLRKAVSMIQELEQGNFDARLEVEKKHQVKSIEEFRVLAKAMNLMATRLGALFKDIAEGVMTLNHSSNQLSAVSTQMSSGTEEASTQVYIIAASAEELNVNVKTVADTIDKASKNVKGIEQSIEQLAHTVTEIAENSEKGRDVVGKAVARAQTTSSIMNDLKGAAQAIGNVTDTINEISEQINLLALNATIEAARAGEAGRGFAVVANEIKDLARQTSNATDEIRQRIEGIQKTTVSSVSEIEGISTIISEVDEIVSTIASSVKEQSTATQQIAEKVALATQEIVEVDSNVNQSAVVTAEIAKDINEISQSANEMAVSSSHVSISAEELTGLSDQLNHMIIGFNNQHQDTETSEPNQEAVSDDEFIDTDAQETGSA